MPMVNDKDLQYTFKVPRVWFNQTVAPVATNDLAHGYQQSDIWIIPGVSAYICLQDIPAGGAIWHLL